MLWSIELLADTLSGTHYLRIKEYQNKTQTLIC